MKIKIFLLLTLSLLVELSAGQTTIKMKRQGGVSLIPCKINGLELELIFDTGASDVSISLSEAASMIKNGNLTKRDILGTANYLTANGDVSEGIIININEIEIAGLKLKNVKASIVKNLKAPLLLGQNAISKLGRIELDLNNNTIIILNGKGTYDYSTYSLTDKLDKYYKEYSITKVEKSDNKDGLFFSYTIPIKFKEEKKGNSEIFKNYVGEEYPYGYIVGLDIGLQTLPSLYSDFNACQNYVENINSAFYNIEPSFKLLSLSQTTISYCKTIKNIIVFNKSKDISKLSYQYWIFCGNKCISFIYSIYSSDQKKLISINPDFEEFCNSQISRIIVFNSLENAMTCTIHSNAKDNNKEISIILNNSCEWFKSEGKSDLDLINHFTLSKLKFTISDKNNDLLNTSELSSSQLSEFKNAILKTIPKETQILNSDILTLNKKSFIYFSTKEKNNEEFILTENFYYVMNKRLITIFSFISDKNEENLTMRFKKNQIELRKLLSETEIISFKPKNADDYFIDGVASALLDSFKLAILDFDKAIELNPKYESAYFNRGTSKLRLKNFREAIIDFNKAIELNQNSELYFFGRGVAKFNLLDYTGSLKDFNKAIDLKNDYAEAYYLRGHIRIFLENKLAGCNDFYNAKNYGFEKSDDAINKFCK